MPRAYGQSKRPLPAASPSSYDGMRCDDLRDGGEEEEERKEGDRRVRQRTDKHKDVLSAPPMGFATSLKHIVMPPADASPHLEKLRISPATYCTIVKHPVQEETLFKDHKVVASINVQIDAERFVPQPRGFSSLRGDQPDMAGFILLLYNILIHLVDKVRSAEVEMVAPEKEEGKRQKAAVPTPVQKNSIAMYFEQVPHKDNPSVMVEYRMRIIEHGVEGRRGLLHELHNLLALNNAKQTAQGLSHKPLPVVPIDHLSRATSCEWTRICRAMNPTIFNADNEDLCEDVLHPESPTNPINCFSLKDNCRTAKRNGADPRYTNYEFYIQDMINDKFSFPEEGKNAWRMSPMDFNVTTNQLSTFCLPCEKQDVRIHLAARDFFQKKHGYSKKNRELADKIFSATQTRSAPAIDSNDLNMLQQRIKSEDAQLRAKHKYMDATGTEKMSDAYHTERLHVAKTKWIPLLDAINCPTGNCGPALQQITTYRDLYVQANETLYVPRMRSFHNLTRQANHFVADACEMDKVMTVLSMHQDVLLMLWSVLHTYSNWAMNLNHLLLGPAGIGKSYGLLVLAKLMIPGTYEKVTYMTAKAFAVNGKEYAFMVFLFEDAAASMFEKSGKTGTSNDFLNMHKQILTSIEVVARAVNMEPKRNNEKVKGASCVTWLAAMNNTRDTLDFAVLDRYCVTNATQNTMEDGAAAAMMAATQRMHDPMIKAAVENMCEVFRHHQMCMAELEQAEAAGILRPVNLSCSDYFFSVLDEIASKHHMPMMKRQRHLDRYRVLVRVLVYKRVVDLLYHCPGAVFKGLKYDPSHRLMAEKYMFSIVQDAVFAVGMLGRQWQDKTRTSLIECMVRCWFPDAKKHVEKWKADKGRAILLVDGTPEDVEIPAMPEAPMFAPMPLPPGQKGSAQRNKAAAMPENAVFLKEMDEYRCKVETRKNWVYLRTQLGPSGVAPALSSSKAGGPTTDEILAHLTKHITPRMTETFLQPEIQHTLKELMQDTVTVSRMQYEDEKPDENRVRLLVKDYPKLLVEADSISLALPVIEQQQDAGADLLFQCVQDTCSVLAAASGHLLTASDYLLYGECRRVGDCRYLWRQIKLQSADELTARGIDYKALTRRKNAGHANVNAQRVVQANQGMASASFYTVEHMRRLYPAKSPYSIMDACLDSHAATLRAHEIGLSLEDQRMHPSSDPFEQHAAFVRMEQEDGYTEELMLYPDALIDKQSDVRADDAGDAAAAGESGMRESSLQDSIDEMKAQSAQRADILKPFMDTAKERQRVRVSQSQQPGASQSVAASQSDSQMYDEEHERRVRSKAARRRKHIHVPSQYEGDECEEKQPHDSDMYGHAAGYEEVDPDQDEFNAIQPPSLSQRTDMSYD